MRVAVTGASGFIGRHVLTELSKHEIDIIAVTRDTIRLTGISPAIKVVEMDIACPTQNCFDQMGRPDVLIHLAWNGLPNYNSLHHFEHELPTQYLFLKTLVVSGLKKILVTGSCFEYGMQSGLLSEDMEPCPSNPYGFAKDTLRRQLEYLKTSHPFNLVWSRLFYLYGEGQAENSLFPQLRKAVERGDKAFDMSGGEQLRDYLPVEEVARQIVQLAMAQRDIGAINICSGSPISVRSLVEQWLRDNAWKIELNLGYYPYPDYEPMAFWGDNRKLKQLLETG